MFEFVQERFEWISSLLMNLSTSSRFVFLNGLPLFITCIKFYFRLLLFLVSVAKALTFWKWTWTWYSRETLHLCVQWAHPADCFVCHLHFLDNYGRWHDMSITCHPVFRAIWAKVFNYGQSTCPAIKQQNVFGHGWFSAQNWPLLTRIPAQWLNEIASSRHRNTMARMTVRFPNY